MHDVKTTALVLRRTNYGEADRILNIITPVGKMSVIAKSVRKEKSKLAGSVEMFTLTDITVHQGRSEFGVVTSAKMKKFYGNILADLGKMELASFVLKRINLLAEHSDNPEHFDIAVQVLEALNNNIDSQLVEAWFLFNYHRCSGEQVNLYIDADGEKLNANERYVWDAMENVLVRKSGGDISAEEIKMMRLMLTAKLVIVSRVKDYEKMMSSILRIARAINKI